MSALGAALTGRMAARKTKPAGLWSRERPEATGLWQAVARRDFRKTCLCAGGAGTPRRVGVGSPRRARARRAPVTGPGPANPSQGPWESRAHAPNAAPLQGCPELASEMPSEPLGRSFEQPQCQQTHTLVSILEMAMGQWVSGEQLMKGWAPGAPSLPGRPLGCPTQRQHPASATAV